VEEFEIYDIMKTREGKYTCSCPKWVMNQYVEDYLDIKFEKYFKKISCPVLILPGEEEWESEEIRSSIENYQRLLEASKVVLIPGAMHAYVEFQYPKEFSKEILDFYKEIVCL
jgi:pimeloyl-ACP methyl ester carboxylesterase